MIVVYVVALECFLNEVSVDDQEERGVVLVMCWIVLEPVVVIRL